MKIRCACGEILSDVVMDVPNIGFVIWGDSISDEQTLESAINSFIQSIIESRRDEWVKDYFKVDIESNVSVIHDLIWRSQRMHEVLRCDKCQRIYLEERAKIWSTYALEDRR